MFISFITLMVAGGCWQLVLCICGAGNLLRKALILVIIFLPTI